MFDDAEIFYVFDSQVASDDAFFHGNTVFYADACSHLVEDVGHLHTFDGEVDDISREVYVIDLERAACHAFFENRAYSKDFLDVELSARTFHLVDVLKKLSIDTAVSLHGVSDEAEIRGHRRTYVGSMPGRIVAALQKCGVRNPLMLLDEIDKMGSNYKGDPAAAMLEVLDSEQNSHFSDHYVELPLDLSEVLFIATANDASNIPRPLLDRMEVIEVSSYTENEKLHIAEEFLLPKQKKKNGLKDNQLTIEKEALEAMISGYTKEAGVRDLERKIGQICRKAARAVIGDKKAHLNVQKTDLETYLGKARYTFTEANEKPEIGIVRGLAWTSVGGDTLQIEVNLMPGKGELILTGNLGDVMKESARIGISYIRSIGEQYGLDAEFFKNQDVHIHIPEGAVPKDGPSAGITMTTAMLSAMAKIPVRADVAMTGEVTLRGRVLPIGGLKEKLLAAKKAGMKLVLVPVKNRPDVEELDKEITEGMEIRFVTEMAEVIEQAFVKE